MMVDTCPGLIEKDAFRPPLRCSDTQLGFFSAHRVRANPSDVFAKSAHGLQHFPFDAGTTAIGIPYDHRPLRNRLIGTTHHPVKFWREPLRACARPTRNDRSTSTQHMRRGAAPEQTLQPLRLSF